MRCPPVPPPANRTFTTPPKCAMRNVECGVQGEGRDAMRRSRCHSALRIPHSALSCSHAPPAASDADQHPDPDEGDEQARPHVRDEWTRDARGREGSEPYAD